MNLSVVILTYNNKNTILRVVDSCKKIADEILIVDSGSSDGSIELLENYELVRIVKRDMDDFSRQRNFAISKAKGHWILMLDSDEYLSEELAEDILITINNAKLEVYEIKRKHIICGKVIKFCDYNNYTNMGRLFKKGCAQYSGLVHEKLDYSGKRGKLKGWCYHETVINYYDFAKKLVSYSRTEAKNYCISGGKKVTGLMIFHRTAKSFFKRYIKKLGFLDGTTGLIICLMESYYSFLIYSFIYDLQNNKKISNGK